MAKTLEKVLSVDLLRIDAETQCRVSINEDVVEDYAETIEQSSKWPFAAVDVFHDGNHYRVADGFHRTLAAKRAKRGSVPCVVHIGTAVDARIFGMTANDRHGLRMSREDKRFCVEWLLDNKPTFTQTEVAEKAGVTSRTVRRIVAERRESALPKNGTLSRSSGGGSSKKTEQISAKGKPGVAAPASSSSAPASSVPASEPVVHSEEAADVPLMKCPRCGRGAKEVSDSGYCGRIDCGTDEPGGERPNYGKCPNCAGTKWTEAEDGVTCSKCNQPHGVETGGVDVDRIAIQRSKTVKTVEALMRAFDDLNVLLPKDWHGEVIAKCKSLLVDAKGWK